MRTRFVKQSVYTATITTITTELPITHNLLHGCYYYHLSCLYYYCYYYYYYTTTTTLLLHYHYYY